MSKEKNLDDKPIILLSHVYLGISSVCKLSCCWLDPPIRPTNKILD
jgi:hypothetical protein